MIKEQKVTILTIPALLKAIKLVFWPGPEVGFFLTNSETGVPRVSFWPQSVILSVNALGYRAE